ncbi:signal peptidase II [Pigmentiphaga soli]|uniref:Lipoprotein signal peptidase n=1 Tax=Pigmentiphaga soli TaxID=1007095 RepID=A0ABP8HHJ8_9BURK
MAARGGSRLSVWLMIAGVVVVLDQLTKIVIDRTFAYGHRMELLPVLDLTRVYNRGAAFSFLAGAAGWQRWFFTALALVVAVVIVWMLARHGHQRLFAWALALILGGAVGNVIDRLLHGHVVDFILAHYRGWFFPAFNVADSAITVGAVMLVLDELLRVRRSR